MLNYINSFFIKKPNNRYPPKFCYIIGSFAYTAPLLRTPESDIDILCSRDMDEFEIRYYLEKKFPQLPRNIQLDIKHTEPNSGKIDYIICYWQQGKYIALVDNKEVTPIAYRKPKTLTCILRDP